MARPDPIEYAERLYGAIRAANFSPISFLAFGNAVKDGVAMRNIPRIAVEPFMRVVGEMLDLEERATDSEIIDATIADGAANGEAKPQISKTGAEGHVVEQEVLPPVLGSDNGSAAVPEKRRSKR